LNKPSFKNIIFDLGGVIINLSVPDTFAAFAQASGKPLDEVSKHASHQAFLDYEKGLLSDQQFREEVKNVLNWKADEEVFDHCWNAMLLDIPIERLQLLERLKKEYRIFLLSNTNEIHLKKFNHILNTTSGKESMDHYFHKAYYSHRMKMRKPDAEIFEFVLKENQLNPEETLFLDDNVSNLEGAAQTGIQTFHVKTPDLIFSLF
jgi:glucose-1-phosphatase